MCHDLKDVTASRDELNREIAGRKRAEDELKELNEELEQRVTERTRELKEAQERVIRSEKLAAVGQIASSVGHEIRSPMLVIANSVDFLGDILGVAGEKVKRRMEILRKAIQRTNEIIEDLLEFPEAKPPSFTRDNVNRFVIKALAGLTIPENVTIKTGLEESLPDISLDTGQIQQVFHNLITNAVQAMPFGGVLEIKTAVKGNFVEIVFTDTGVGIPEDKLQHVFEPLFSTKDRGTGLGLSIVEGIVDRHKGGIGVKSRAGGGSTTFIVKLPIQIDKGD
jgi:signal transduction histidine kinase